jgi:capsule polysaccharide export protein KpsE/RkpR
MVESDESIESNNVSRFDVSSKFWRILLVIVSVFLVFAGPTYVSYLLFDILNVNYIASVVVGFALFIVGILLMWFLVRKKIIV